MPINDIDDFLVIPPIYRISSQQYLREKRRKYPLSKEERAARDREYSRLAKQSEAKTDEAARTAAADAAAAAEAQKIALEESEAALEAAIAEERRQLQQIKDAAENAPSQMAQENSMAVMADILMQMAEMIQQLIDTQKNNDKTAASIEEAFAALEAMPHLRVEDVEGGALTPEEVLKQHLENLALFVKRNAETAYHVRQSPKSRPDASPVVPPLHHEDEYV